MFNKKNPIWLWTLKGWCWLSYFCWQAIRKRNYSYGKNHCDGIENFRKKPQSLLRKRMVKKSILFLVMHLIGPNSVTMEMMSFAKLALYVSEYKIIGSSQFSKISYVQERGMWFNGRTLWNTTACFTTRRNDIFKLSTIISIKKRVFIRLNVTILIVVHN